MKGIGLFGGTFNPLHNGHLKVAEDVRAQFQMEKIYFIPSALPPHKKRDNLADAGDRYQMIEFAISGYPKFDISDVEIQRKGLSYSIDTVRYFKKKFPSATCYLIVGMDAFLEVDTWKSYGTFFDLIPIIVMTRPAESAVSTLNPAEELESYIQAHVDQHYEFSPPTSCFVHPERQPVFLCHVTPMDISSTRIRNLIKQGKSITTMVPASVEKYIYKKGLYL